jgi:hypothetical protein
MSYTTPPTATPTFANLAASVLAGIQYAEDGAWIDTQTTTVEDNNWVTIGSTVILVSVRVLNYAYSGIDHPRSWRHYRLNVDLGMAWSTIDSAHEAGPGSGFQRSSHGVSEKLKEFQQGETYVQDRGDDRQYHGSNRARATGWFGVMRRIRIHACCCVVVGAFMDIDACFRNVHDLDLRKRHPPLETNSQPLHRVTMVLEKKWYWLWALGTWPSRMALTDDSVAHWHHDGDHRLKGVGILSR